MGGNHAWRKMEELCDGIGHRLSGSPQLEQAILWAAERMRGDGLQNVRLEPVTVPRWVRGEESLELIAPRHESLVMLGLGGSVGTPPEGITGEVVVVDSEESLTSLGSDAIRGKIVLFNNPMPPFDPSHGTQYGSSVKYRVHGARLASEMGATACLVRSVTAGSLRTPHTGSMRYGDVANKIPAAALTVEDASMIARLVERRIPVSVTLKMEAKNHAPVESANVIGEIIGRERPEEIVVIGGHIDSWDVGQGAHDDACGCILAMEAARILKQLNLIPRRTIRVVLWTNEENGLGGGKQYAKNHQSQMLNHVAAIESDSGCFAPRGFGVKCNNKAKQDRAVVQMQEIMKLVESLGARQIIPGQGAADVSPMVQYDVVVMGHEVEQSTYFHYHHTPADTLDKIDPHDLSRNVAMLATVAYVLADMEERIGDAP